MKALTMFARIALTLAVFGAILPAQAADAGKGSGLYAMHCTGCHGRNGVPVMPGAPNFSRNDGLMQPDFVIMNSIKTGKNAMPGYVGILKDAEILDIISFMRTLQK